MSTPRDRGGERRSRLPDWSDLALPLPAVTAERIASASRRPVDGDNVGLWLDKLLFRRRHGWTLDREDRTFAFSQLCRGFRSDAGKAAADRQRETLEALHPKGDQRQGLTAGVHGRLLVDYGRINAAEASVSFHPIWGVPRIPGSALKGVTLAEMRMDDADPAELAEIFGSQAAAGRVIFYDALPVDGRFELALDVLTPHHRDYYEGKGPPADWESPIPHSFITVVKTTFAVWLGARSGEKRDVDVLARAGAALKRALEDSGVGAKTAAGYGRLLVEPRR
jgi:CRISPR-associated protein Cmr6